MNIELVGKRRIGKKAPRFDKRTLSLARYTAALPDPPALSSWVAKVPFWPMLANDVIGDCTCAAAGHMEQQWMAYHLNKNFIPNTADIVKAYSDVSGYVLGDPSTDNGAVMLDVLRYWRRFGIAGHRISAYASLQPGDWRDLKQSIMLFGSAYIGLALPLSAMADWNVAQGGIYGAAGRPGGWGGHCVPVVAYDDNCFVVVTWGGLFLMSYNFYLDYCDEAYAVMSPDWVSRESKAPSGFDLDALKSDLVALAA